MFKSPNIQRYVNCEGKWSRQQLYTMPEQEDEYDNVNESDKISIQKQLFSMGFLPNYIDTAFKIYETNYGYGYNIEVITDIIVRLQCKDEVKQNKNYNDDNKMMDMKSEEKQSVCIETYDIKSVDNNAENKNNNDMINESDLGMISINEIKDENEKEQEEWNTCNLIPPELILKRIRHLYFESQKRIMFVAELEWNISDKILELYPLDINIFTFDIRENLQFSSHTYVERVSDNKTC
eukprot:16319_1